MQIKEFLAQHPPQSFENHGMPAIVYARTDMRLVLQWQQAEIGYGLWRVDELARKGIDAAALDTKEFASSLVDALVPKLSQVMLEEVVAQFQAKLDYLKTVDKNFSTN